MCGKKNEINTASSAHARLAVIHSACILLFMYIDSEVNTRTIQ